MYIVRFTIYTRGGNFAVNIVQHLSCSDAHLSSRKTYFYNDIQRNVRIVGLLLQLFHEATQTPIETYRCVLLTLWYLLAHYTVELKESWVSFVLYNVSVVACKLCRLYDTSARLLYNSIYLWYSCYSNVRIHVGVNNISGLHMCNVINNITWESKWSSIRRENALFNERIEQIYCQFCHLTLSQISFVLYFLFGYLIQIRTELG